MIAYDEPVPGLDADGKEVTCNRQVVMSEEDAIAHQRYVASKHPKKRVLTDEEHLADFIVVHWAYYHRCT